MKKYGFKEKGFRNVKFYLEKFIKYLKFLMILGLTNLYIKIYISPLFNLKLYINILTN